MGKEKKKLGIKTSRYFTKKCTKCSLEYPNWFTNCPKCGTSWDDTSIVSAPAESLKKTIKIVVKITEETFNKSILSVKLIFSADQGQSWYQMEMDSKVDYFIAEIAEVPLGSVIIYYVEVFLEDGEKIIENNDGKYFFYKVGEPIGENDSNLSKEKVDKIKERFSEPPTKPQRYQKPPIETPPPKTYITNEMVTEPTAVPLEKIEAPKVANSKEYTTNNLTIFGKPQTEIDPDLKVCIHCKSKIKKMWSTCPICGKSL
ncbi:MAG: hypothetical protein ACFFEY_01420 [Candidatus Thorarchaeota archaeon]